MSKRHTKETLIEEIKRYHEEFEVVPTISNLNNTKGYPSRSTINKHFTNYNDAVRLAGFKPATLTKIDKQEKEQQLAEQQTVEDSDFLKKLVCICKKLNQIPTKLKIATELNVSSYTLDKQLKEAFGEFDWKNYLRDMGYGEVGDVFLRGMYVSHESLELKDYIVLWKEFKEKHGRFPGFEDCGNRRVEKYNLPTEGHYIKMLKKNNLSQNDFKDLTGNTNKKPVVELYDDYVEKYRSISEKCGYPLTYYDLIDNKHDLPSTRWLVKHCPDKNVTNFSQFIEWCGFKPRYEMSKELATELILGMQERLDRPLMIRDFDNPCQNEVGIHTVEKIWGSLNGMKEELGLEIVQDSMVARMTDVETIKLDLATACNKAYEDSGRKLIIIDEIAEFGNYSWSTYEKYLRREEGVTAREFLKSIGFELQEAGTGLVHEYGDGEVTTSQYEKQFTDYLRRAVGLRYGIDYHRNIKYSGFIKDYDGLMDCDYVITHKGKTLYIEVAGMLRDYKEWYYKDTPINSNIREKYRLKLKTKESLLKDSGLDYYIVFPSDITEDTLSKIIK